MSAESFFTRFFAALDSQEPQSAMALVAENMEFCILWAPDAERRSVRQFVGGPEELRAFTAAGDTTGWAHHITQCSHDGTTEIALGETRWDSDGRHIGTFIAAGELDEAGRLARYFVARSPVLRFPTRLDVGSGA